LENIVVLRESNHNALAELVAPGSDSRFYRELVIPKNELRQAKILTCQRPVSQWSKLLQPTTATII